MKQNNNTKAKESMGRDEQTHTDKETRDKTNKHRNTQKPSRCRNNGISVLVVLVLLLQHPVLVLVFK
jgi:hypothetical protein